MQTTHRTILDTPVIARVRRNHGLEHATLSILARKYKGVPIAGHSNPTGFWVIGDVSTEALADAVVEAQRRLRAGEHHLAVHPNCGTNFVTSGVFAGIAGAAAMFGVGPRRRDKLERLPLAALLATLALIVARPLGLLVQERITTTGDIGDLQVVEIQRASRGGIPAHRVITQG